MVQFDFSKIMTFLPELLPYIPITLLILAVSLFFGTLLGLVLAAWQLGEKRLLKTVAQGYIFILRCTPPIVLLFIVYYGLPELMLQLFQVNINGIDTAVFVIVAMVLLFGATAAETFRSAYLAINPGQREAGLAIGMSEWEAFYRIILPQAALVALPSYNNSLVSLLKAGTLAYTIGLIDVMGGANLLVGRNYGNFALEAYVAVTLIYWLIVLAIELLFKLIEKRLANRTVDQPETALAVEQQPIGGVIV